MLGQPVSKSTMLNHRRVANRKRVQLGRGKFGWGVKVPDGSADLISFDCMDSLIEHPSGDEHTPSATRRHRNLPNQPETPHALFNSEYFDALGNTSMLNPQEDQNCSLDGSEIEQPWRSRNSTAGISRSLPPVPPSSVLDQQQESPMIERSSLSPKSLGGEQQHSDEQNQMESVVVETDALSSGNEASGQPNFPVDEGLLIEDSLASGFSRIPELQPWLIANKNWVELFYRHALTEAFLDEACVNLKAPCQQWKTIMRNVSQATGLHGELETYTVCDGHMAFVPLNDSVVESEASYPVCTECGANRASKQAHEERYQYLPVIPRIRAMVQDCESCEQLYSYRRLRSSDGGIFTDYFDGECYKELCGRYGGEACMSNDVFILASTDGFAPYKNRNYDMWSVAALNFNLPPHLRYAPQNVMPLSFIPGPSQPKNLQSFLLPFVREMRRAADGAMMRFHDETQRLVRINLIGFTGDQPAICKTADLVGPNGKSPCRDCKIQGIYTNHYYFPSKVVLDSRKVRRIYDPRNLPLRSVLETRNTILSLEQASGAQLKQMQTNSGIRETSVLFKLPNVIPYSYFPHDIMHTFYNIQKELLRIILGPYDDAFSLSKHDVQMLDNEISGWKWGISGQLGPKPKPLIKFKEWKAAEHKTFSISHSQVLFDGYLPKVYMDGLELFAEIVDISSRGEVAAQDVQRLRKVCVDFFEHYERHYAKHRMDRVDFCKSIFHILLHLPSCMQRYGPLIGVSQYWLEGYIGWVGNRNNSKKRPAQSMMKNGMFGEALKIFYGASVYGKNTAYEGVIEEGGFVLQGPFKTMGVQGRMIRSLLISYFRRKYENISEEEAGQVAELACSFRFSSRICFTVGTDIQTARVHLKLGGREPESSSFRSSSFVAVEMEESHQLMSVWYGRLLHLISFDLSAYGEGKQRFGPEGMTWRSWIGPRSWKRVCKDRYSFRGR